MWGGEVFFGTVIADMGGAYTCKVNMPQDVAKYGVSVPNVIDGFNKVNCKVGDLVVVHREDPSKDWYIQVKY